MYLNFLLKICFIDKFDISMRNREPIHNLVPLENTNST